jgi:hypothetical protein
VADDECSDLADHYRLKLTLDGCQVAVLAAEDLTAQHAMTTKTITRTIA